MMIPALDDWSYSEMFPFAPAPFLLLLLALAFLLAMVQVGLFSLAFEKLGLSPVGAMWLLFGALGGSLVNIPLFSIRAETNDPADTMPVSLRRLLRVPMLPFTGRTLIAINLGGALIPLFFSLYLMLYQAVDTGPLLMATMLVSMVSYGFSRPIPGIGIGMPVLVAPFSAALIAIVLAPENSAPLAYCCGTLGVLIGADLLRLRDVRKLGTARVSIGGAGTFDGIFLTGIVAALLA